jgi:signal transduction histidine kinase
MQLHDFIRANDDALIRRIRSKSASRSPSPGTANLDSGIPIFLRQVAEILRLESSPAPVSPEEVAKSATQHGSDLQRMGFTVSQVVHAYGDVCQAITELAIEAASPVSTDEFRILNRTLDTAIAESCTEYDRLKDEAVKGVEAESLGRLAHELRNKIQTALLSYRVLKAGTVGIGGSTGAVLGRSLVELSAIIDKAVAEVRLTGTTHRRERVDLRGFIDEVAAAARLLADFQDLEFNVEGVEAGLAIEVDRQLLASAAMNLLQNAFKYTRPKGRVSLRTRVEHGRVYIEVHDECGGLREHQSGAGGPAAADERRGSDRSGLGLGLAISRKAVAACGGAITSRDLPGRGCIFTIELPLAGAGAAGEPPPAPDRLQVRS